MPDVKASLSKDSTPESVEPIVAEFDSSKHQRSLAQYLRNPDHSRGENFPPPKVLSKAIETALSKDSSLFKELYENPDTYGVRIEDLLMWAQDCYERTHICKDLRSLVFDKECCSKMGDVDRCIAQNTIPLKSADGSIHFFMTKEIDNEILKGKLETMMTPDVPIYAICTPVMWRTIMIQLVEPQRIAYHASVMKVTSGSKKSSVIDTQQNDSEARNLYRIVINAGYASRASDIHFIPQENDCLIIFRVDGIEQLYSTIPKLVLNRIVNILMADGGVPQKKPKDPIDAKVRFTLKATEQEVDLRVSIIPSKFGPDVNIRYLTSNLMTMEQLGMSKANIKQYCELLDLPQGMIVQVGPTGSGKSTTLYSGLSYIHRTLKNIITIEDPVEVIMPGITQIDVEKGSDLDFPQALKATLRHDPDVVVVGEMRDAATAADAVRAANTGHLVITSLHTNDSIGVIERMITLGIEPYALGEVLVAVMGQRLVRRLCPKCKKKVTYPSDHKYIRLFNFPKDKTYQAYAPVGCEYCDGKGYRGRVAVNEILVVDATLRELIQRHATRGAIEKYLRTKGWKPMIYDGLLKVNAGITSFAEMEKFAKDITSFRG